LSARGPLPSTGEYQMASAVCCKPYSFSK